MTKPMIEFGGGIEAGSNLYFDAGYRYMRIIDDDGLNVSRAYVGVGVRF